VEVKAFQNHHNWMGATWFAWLGNSKPYLQTPKPTHKAERNIILEWIPLDYNLFFVNIIVIIIIIIIIAISGYRGWLN
jgi:hypothetical protein